MVLYFRIILIGDNLEKIKKFINDYIIEQVKFSWNEFLIKQDKEWEDSHWTIKSSNQMFLLIYIYISLIFLSVAIQWVIELDYVKVDATVDKIIEYPSRTTSGKGGTSGHTFWLTKAIFVCEYNGEIYRVESYRSGKYYTLGKTYTIRINPDDPTIMAKASIYTLIIKYINYTILLYPFPLFVAYSSYERFFLIRREKNRASIIKYTFKDAEIILENHVIDTIELKDCVIILIDIDSKNATHIPRNVYCYDTKGELIWQIDPSNNMFGIKPDVDEYEFEKIAYQNNYLYVITKNIAFAIDIKTGKYIAHNFM